MFPVLNYNNLLGMSYGYSSTTVTSDIPRVNYVPASISLTTSIDIPMNDADSDHIECRFEKSSNISRWCYC
jgi:hypothetical protein